jgi:hypothetical protein
MVKKVMSRPEIGFRRMTNKLPYPGVTWVNSTLLHFVEGYSAIDSLN